MIYGKQFFGIKKHLEEKKKKKEIFYEQNEEKKVKKVYLLKNVL